MIKFFAYGHKNILGKHKNTFEFTKDKEISLRADCIIGVNSNFNLEEIKKFIKQKNKIRIVIKVDELEDDIECEINSQFNDENEIVIRRSDYKSERTLGIRSNKTCIDINSKIIDKMKESNKKMEINITDV